MMARGFNAARRTITQELLDTALGPDAEASLNDIRRINLWLGGRLVLRQVLKGATGSGDTILDVGAASGDQHRPGVISLDWLERNLQRAPHPKVVADAFALPFGPASVDVVMANLFLHHFEDHDIVRLLADFRRVARRAVVITDLQRNVAAYKFLPWTNWFFNWNRITLHDAPASVAAAFTKEELESLARRAGFANVRVQVHRPWFRLSMVGRAR